MIQQSSANQYGMGWYTLPVDDESILFHSGDDANFHADMALLPGVSGAWWS